MPCPPRRARLLLRRNKAVVVRRAPFTIRLTAGSSGHRQHLALGIDTGFGTAGVSVVSPTKEILNVEVRLRGDVSKRVTDRRMHRRSRRSRLRYRKPRFLNRKKNQALAPSIHGKVDEHLRIERWVKSMLPISRTVIEMGGFDPHKLKNPLIEGVEYQRGGLFGYENVKAFVLSRDGHRCQAGRKSCVKKLHVHHIIWRSRGGGDAPSNLITVCERHHKQIHDGKLDLKAKSPTSYRAATAMNVIRSQLIKLLPEAVETFGYVTKVVRRSQGLEKSHRNDAFVIAGGDRQRRAEPQKFLFKRKNNRSLQKNRKGYRRSIRRKRYLIQPYDLVRWEGRLCRTKGTQGYGKYLRLVVNGETIMKRVDAVEVVLHEKTLVRMA